VKQIDLKKISLSFERPKDSIVQGYEFLKNPPKVEGGGLPDQVVMVKEEVSLHDLFETFMEISDNLSDILGEEYAYLIASILSLSWNSTSIKLFPDEYKEILDLVKETDNDYSLDQKNLNQLIDKDSNVIIILDALIKEGFLRKKRNGDYVVRKKFLTNIHFSFLQIADR
jgi:hypothetical protein